MAKTPCLYMKAQYLDRNSLQQVLRFRLHNAAPVSLPSAGFQMMREDYPGIPVFTIMLSLEPEPGKIYEREFHISRENRAPGRELLSQGEYRLVTKEGSRVFFTGWGNEGDYFSEWAEGLGRLLGISDQ